MICRVLLILFVISGTASAQLSGIGFGPSVGSGQRPGSGPSQLASLGACTLNASSISLSNSTFPGGSPSGTSVGTIIVTPTGGGCAAVALSLSGTNASSFQISGVTLETSGVVASGTYNINIVATISGAVGSPYSQPEVITGIAAGCSNQLDFSVACNSQYLVIR